MRRFDFLRPLVVATIVVAGATSSASMQPPAPPAPPSQAELQWLQQMGSQQEPVYSAVDRCEQLLGNAGSAWQLTPQNVPDCEAGRGRKSPINSINIAAAPCWIMIGKIIVELNAALVEYRRADELRTRPESTPLFKAGVAHAQAALAQIPNLRACVQQVHDEGDANVRRLRGAIGRTGLGSGTPNSGGSTPPQPLNERLGQGLHAGDPNDPKVLPVINDGRNFALGLADGTQQCLAQFAALAGAVAQLTINNQWGELDQLLGIRQYGWGPVLKRWADDAIFDAMHSMQEPQGLPQQLTAQQASQLDYLRGRLAGVRLCTFGAAGGAAKLAEAGVGRAGGVVLQRIADAARSTASQRLRLAASVAENVVRDVAARADRTVTGAEQTKLVQALAEVQRAEAASLGTMPAGDAFERNIAMAKAILSKLEGDTIYLPGAARGQALKVTLGKQLGEGSFGWVFDVTENGRPGPQVIKVLGNTQSYRDWGFPVPPGTKALIDNMGGDSLLSQAKGAIYLQKLGIPTPKIGYMHAAEKTGEFSFALMEKIDTAAPNIDVWNSVKFAPAAKRAAIIDLYQRLAVSGYVAADLAPRNVYFILKDGAIRAGVLDADLIIPTTFKDDAATLTRFEAVVEGAANRESPLKDINLALFKNIDYRNPSEAMQKIRIIQWGF